MASTIGLLGRYAIGMANFPDLGEQKLASIVAADVAGYSQMMEADESGTLARLKAHIVSLSGPVFRLTGGHVVKTTGDGLLARFASVVEAVGRAIEIQLSMAERNTGEDENSRILFRFGINFGDVIFENGDIFGDGVNVASRLEGLAEPGGVCISDIVHQTVTDRIGVPFRDMGNQRGRTSPDLYVFGSGRPTRRRRRQDVSRPRQISACSLQPRPTACRSLGQVLAREHQS